MPVAGPPQAIKQKIKLKYSHGLMPHDALEITSKNFTRDWIYSDFFFFHMVCYLLSQANTGCLEEDGREHSLKQGKDRPVDIRSKCVFLGRKNVLNCWCHPTCKENHRMAWVVRGFEIHLLQIPLPWAAKLQLDQVAQSTIQSDLGYFQGWSIYDLSGQPVPVFLPLHNIISSSYLVYIYSLLI